MLRTRATRSSSRAVRGKCSPRRTAGTDVAMGRYSPRISAGASGFGARVSKWRGAGGLEVAGAAVVEDEDAGSDATRGSGRAGRSGGRREAQPSEPRGVEELSAASVAVRSHATLGSD